MDYTVEREPFDSNAFLLPSSKEERKRLAALSREERPTMPKAKEKKPSKRVLRKLEQLKVLVGVSLKNMTD